MAFRRKKRRISPYSRTRSLPKRRVKQRRSPGKTHSVNREPKNKTSDRRKLKAAKRARGFFGKIKRPIILILGGALIIYITFVLFVSTSLTIQTIQVKEDDMMITEHPMEDLLSELIGSNLLLTNTDNFEPYLRAQFPQYETLRITKNLPDTLLVILKTYPVVSNLTVEIPDSEDQQFLLTSGGQVTTYEDIDSMGEGLRTIIIESEKSLGSGAQVMDQSQIAFILEAMQDFEDRFGMGVGHAQYHDIEREVHLWTAREFYVWLDMTQPLDDQLDKLKKGLPKLDIYTLNLEYIDLRIAGLNGEKIIFKRS